MARNIGQASRRVIVQIEEQKVIFQAWTEIEQLESVRLLVLQQHRKILRADAVQDVSVACLKPEHLCVLGRHKKVDNLFEVRKPGTFAIDLPIEGITFQHDALAGDIFLQAKWPEARDRLRHIQAPGAGEFPFLVRLLEQMPRKHGNTVEEPFGRCVGLWELELHRELVELCTPIGLPSIIRRSRCTECTFSSR